MRLIAVAAASLLAAACASTPEAAGPPDFSRIATTPSPNARFYADCIAQAAALNRYGHAYDEVHVVVFTCEGEPAHAFFEALGPWSAQQQSEVTVGDRVIRSTTRIERDLFAADYCEREGAAYRCAISLRTGEFAEP
jgi:hypothetical protein